VTSVTITKPSGVVANDLLYAFIAIARDYTPAGTITAPSGWTMEVDFPLVIVGLDDLRHVVYSKRAGASEPANYQWTLAGESYVGGLMLAYSGGITSDPYVDVKGTGSTGTSGNPTAASITTTVADTLVVHGVIVFNEFLVTPPSGSPTFTERADLTIFEVSDAIFASAAATGAKNTTPDDPTGWTALMLAFKPATAAAVESSVLPRSPYLPAQPSRQIMSGLY